MNDCFWYGIGICEEQCECLNYISVNSIKGEELSNEYQDDIDNALIPVHNKYEVRFKQECNNIK